MGRPSQMNDDNNPEGEQFRKLFIGGLDYRTTDQGLKSFFEQWGEIVDVVVMKHPQTQKSRGFGFVTYAVSSMVDEAMKNRPHKIDNREVDSKRAVPRDASGSAANNVNVKKMFVGGLKEQSDDEIREYFSQFGGIIGVNIVVDKTTGKRKGYAFIEYNDYDPVDKALLIRDHQIGGKSVTVKKAVVREGPGGPGGPGGPAVRGGRGGGAGGRGGGRAPASSWGGGAGTGWGGSNGYSSGGSGPWDGSQGNGWNNGGGGGGGWDQYGGGGWNGAAAGGGGGGGYGQQGGFGGGGGGGPVRSNYNTSGQRNAPYGGGYGGNQWGGNARY